MSNLIFQQQGSSPTQAGAGYSQLYAKTDGKIYQQIESGGEATLGVPVSGAYTADGAVGIGTTNPQGMLHVKSTGSTASLSGYDAPNHAIFGLTGAIPISASAIPKAWGSLNQTQADPGGDTFGMGYNVSSMEDNSTSDCYFNLIEPNPHPGYQYTPIIASHTYATGYSFQAAVTWTAADRIWMRHVYHNGALTYGASHVHFVCFWH